MCRWGVREELLPLLTPKLPAMTPKIAQALHKHGYRTLELVAASTEAKLAKAMREPGAKARTRRAATPKNAR